MEEKKIVIMSVSDLLPGMIAARDIYTRNDQLLIPKGAVIDSTGITRITLFGVMSVAVYVEEEEIQEFVDDTLDDEFMTQEEKNDYIEFKKNYQLTVDNLLNNMNQLLKSNVDIDQEKLINDVDRLVYRSRSKYQVFDMLHDMRHFDDETYRHSLNVAMINNVFADWLHMDMEEKKCLTLCGLLHDMGKLLVDRDILRKPAKLTEVEFEEIKQHPVRGYQNMKDRKIPESVKRAILLHHERCDGKGYPFGFTTSEIDPYAAITSIADVYEAMTATRVYRKGMSPFDVIRILEEDGKKQFNPIFLVPLLNHMANTYLQHRVLLNNGLIGKVVLINKGELSRPMIMMEDGTFIDLSIKRDINIVEVL